jgi:hypothetical protein
MSCQWGAGNSEKAALVGLKDEVARVATQELRESKTTREQALQQFREWILKNQDICNCRTGNCFTDRLHQYAGLRLTNRSVIIYTDYIVRHL